jgi:tetratricopeptide (TPR) repeat protein
MRYFNGREFSKALEEFDRLLNGGRDRSNLDMELARFYAAEAHTKLGLDYLRRNEHARAKVEFRSALEVEGSFPDLYFYLGNLARGEGECREALVLLDRALELNPLHREALACRALARRGAGEGAGARDDLMRLVTACFPMPEIAAAQTRPPLRASECDAGGKALPERRLAGVLAAYDRGFLGDALDALGGVIESAPGYPDLRYRQGRLLTEMNRLHEAVASYDAALGLNPDYVHAALARGVCLLALNRPDRAERSLAHAAALRPEYADVAFYHGVSLSRMGKLREGLEPLERALEINPGFWRAHFVAGQIHASLGDLERGFRSLDRALAHHRPESRDGLPGTGDENGSRSASASHRLAAAVAAHPDYADLHLELGLALLEDGDVNGARRAFQGAIAVNPGYATAHYHLGMLEIRGGKPAAAFPHWTRALDGQSERADLYRLMGDSRLAAGDSEGAGRAYERALDPNPAYLGALLGLGKVRLAQRRNKEARELFRRAREIDPDCPLPRTRILRSPEMETVGSG